MKKAAFLFIFSVAVFLTGCGKKTIQVSEWDQFQDQFFKVGFVYPKGWVVAREANRIVISSSQEVADKFFDHDARKPDGVQLIIASERSDSMQDYEKYIESYKKDQQDAGFAVQPTEDTKIEGLPAKMFEYSGAFDEQTKIKAVRAATLKDSVIYFVQYAGFNGTYEPGKFVFDSVIATLTLPKPKVISKDPNAIVLPSPETKIVKNAMLEVTVPDNMGETYPAVKGDVVFAMNLKIYREDCTMDIDVRPAKKLSLEKVIEQNSKKIANVSGKGSVTVGGEKAQYFNYTPTRGIKSRIYFVVKNDKIYRIIFNYYVPMESNFLPVYEKIIASIRLK